MYSAVLRQEARSRLAVWRLAAAMMCARWWLVVGHGAGCGGGGGGGLFHTPPRVPVSADTGG